MPERGDDRAGGATAGRRDVGTHGSLGAGVPVPRESLTLAELYALREERPASDQVVPEPGGACP